MPELSRFYGIIIGMYYDDHPPPLISVRLLALSHVSIAD
jgi:hypothetical protein